MNIQHCYSDDKILRKVFSWLARIGAGPKFGSRPIGWYQQHMCNAISFLEACGTNEFRLKGEYIQSKVDGKWKNCCTPRQVWDFADKR